MNNEDPFEARLRRLKDQADGKGKTPRPQQKSVELPKTRKRHADQSIFLPVAALALLLVGGVAFAMMLFLPDVSGGAIANHLVAE